MDNFDSNLTAERVRINGEISAESTRVLSPEALNFVARLEEEFGERRRQLLAMRARRQEELQQGALPAFLTETADIRRDPDWRISPTPRDLQLRRVEITGPTERKMLINALNSGASVFMADFEDANSPTWANMVQGQCNLMDAVSGEMELTTSDGKVYRLSENPALLMVRPRGWHLEERHFSVNGRSISASLFDFGLFFFHNARPLMEKGSGPYFYLPKLESHLEARLWNAVFNFAQDELGIPRGTIKATVLIETLLAAFEMEEILYELREHAAGLNAGRWDYIFSVIKTFRSQPGFVLPDRAQVTMTTPFMRAYTELLVHTCHKRGAHAIGGMAAYIPSRRDPEVNEQALEKVRQDKEREAGDGFDGTWVAHPDLVPVAMEVFDRQLGKHLHQKDRLREDVKADARKLLDFKVPGGQISEEGLRLNINVGIQYLEAWLRGTGAVAIYNLMEDTATAEISRAQVWQWIHSPKAELADGRKIDVDLYNDLVTQEIEKIRGLVGEEAFQAGKYEQAVEIFSRLSTDDDFLPFLTWAAYEHLS